MKPALETPFDFQPLTRVLFGPGEIRRLGEAAHSLGGKRVLLVTDPGLNAAGHPQRARASLESSGLEVTLFDRVAENPTTEHVDAGVAVAKKAQIDLIAAVGGGSAMDCAKGVNFILTNGGRMQDYWGIGKAKKPMLPSIGVPTTAGTGSEAQSFALIADAKTHAKMACGDKKAAFRITILDPELTVTQPPLVTAYTGIDAVSHAVESYVTTKRNVLSCAFARQAWGLLSSHLETALREPNNLQARAATQLGAHLAGMAIENSMLGATHALANPLTAHFGLTHGLAIGLMLPAVIRFNASFAEPLYQELAGGSEQLAARIEALTQAAGYPAGLSHAGVPRSALPRLAEDAAQQWTAKFNPRPVDKASLQSLYESVA